MQERHKPQGFLAGSIAFYRKAAKGYDPGTIHAGTIHIRHRRTFARPRKDRT